MTFHTFCICLDYLQFDCICYRYNIESTGVSSDLHHGWTCASSGVHLIQMTFHRLHTWMALLWYEWADVSSDFHVGWKTCCTVRNWKASLPCGFACAPSDLGLYPKIFDTGHICATSSQLEKANSLQEMLIGQSSPHKGFSFSSCEHLLMHNWGYEYIFEFLFLITFPFTMRSSDRPSVQSCPRLSK